jgi:hypothetical protein
MTLLDRVSATLAAERLPHALIGAAALAAAGVARSTFDIDLLTGDPRVLQAPLWDRLRGLGVSVDIRRADADDPLGGVVRLELAGERPVDLIVARHPWQARAVERAYRAVGGPPIVQPPDLVLLKLYAGGTQDLWDIRELFRLPGSDAWMAAVEADLAALPVSMLERWRTLLA